MIRSASPHTAAPLALLGALALTALTGCAGMIPLTHELRTQNSLSKDELKNLQFYTSDTITLRRELESGGKQITGNHKLRITEGKTIEEVVIEARTPGIAVNIGDHLIAISFEQGSFMEFAPVGGPATPMASFASASDPDPFPGNGSKRNERLPESPPDPYAGNYALVLGPLGKISYQGKDFEVVDESSKAHLLLDGESLKAVVKKNKVLPGLRLPSH
ncbi:MAG: DNA-directed RNA polymerase [Minicystis sp.]